MIPISAVIITLNEARRIEAAVRPLAFCDEVLVVDSGSTDGTVDIGRRLGCRVLHRDFDGYGPQKRFAIAEARNDWVLSVDADEVVTPELAGEIKERLAGDPGRTRGFYIRRPLVFAGRPLRRGYRRWHLRLFDRRAGGFTSASVHEKVTVSGATARLRGAMLHYSYEGIEDYVAQLNRFTTRAARQMFERRRRGARLNLYLRLPATFLKVYLAKGAFLDGALGFQWAIFSALYDVVKFAKLLELQDAERASGATAPPPGAERRESAAPPKTG